VPYKPINEYEPRQRGQVAAAQKSKGNRLLKNGDITYDECPECNVVLRVRRKKRGGVILWCPCGYEVLATELTAE